MNYSLRNKSTIILINALQEEKSDAGIPASTEYELVITKKGGIEQETWLHEELALEFARWLNPKFRVWCNQRIKEILNQGFSALTPEATEYIKEQVGEAFSPLLYLI